MKFENLKYYGPYGWHNNYPKHTTGSQNGINNGSVYLYNSWYDKINDLSQLGFAAMSADAFFWGIAFLSHDTGYNVLYTDGHAAWFPDKKQVMARESHGTPVCLQKRLPALAPPPTTLQWDPKLPCNRAHRNAR